MPDEHSLPAPPRDDSPRLPPIHETSSRDGLHGAWSAVLDRVQQQVNYNTTAIEDQRRHLAELHEALRTLHGEVGSIWQHVDGCAARLRKAGDRVPRSDIPDVDLLTTQLQAVAAKAAEVDGLKFQLDVMTRRLRRLESHSSPPAAHAQAPVGPSEHQASSHGMEYARACAKPTADGRRPNNPHHPPYLHTRTSQEIAPRGHPGSLPGIRALECAAETSQPKAFHNVQNQPSIFAPSAQAMSTQHARRWSPINTNQEKRPAPIDTSGRGDPIGGGSPKRQKLATLMPRTLSGDHSPPVAPLHHPGTSASSQLGPVPNATGRFVPFPSTAESSVHASWRPDHSGRARAGSQRSNSQEEQEYKTEQPQSSRSSWSGAVPADSQYQRGYEASQYQAVRPAADHHDPHPQQQAQFHHQEQILHHQEQSLPPRQHRHHHDATISHQGSPNPDPYALDHNKKSRTKPTRNADGVLIRKDGRPDMRSVSSAQNLRKVHAKKEAERATSGTTPSAPADAAPGSSVATNGVELDVEDGTATSSVASREVSVDVGSVAGGSTAAYEVRAGREADTPMRDVVEGDGPRHHGHFDQSKGGSRLPASEPRHAVAA